MVVRTRSSYKTAPVAATSSPRRSTRVRLSTPSYTEASVRNYKIYTPSFRPPSHVSDYYSEHDTHEAGEALLSMSLGYDDEPTILPRPTLLNRRCCLNPMRPVTRYIYKLSVYNMAQTTHYNTSYIIYNRDNRTYYVYSIISTILGGGGGGGEDGEYVDLGAAAAASESPSLPAPTHTIQTRYTSYVNLDNYVMKVVIPSEQRDYCVLADFIGVITPDDEFNSRVFSEDSCYYDVDHLWNSTESEETLTGHKMFILTPTRVYYWDGGAGGLSRSSLYTTEEIGDALDILSSVQ